MTTTVSKGGLRAKAKATTTRAAQRTALPPKPPKATAAGARSDRVADAKAELATKRAPKATPAPEVKPDKATHYEAVMASLGWKPTVTRVDGLASLLSVRGNEALFLEWLNDVHVGPTSTYTVADRTVKIRNASEMVRIASISPAQAKAAHEHVSTNKAFRPRQTGPTIRTIPFDPETATDAEVAEALAGRQIQWHNQYRVASETAIVGRNVSVSRHARGHRIVSFVDPETGYRALRLENLENVGRRVDIDRIRQEILASMMREAKRQERASAKAA